MQKLSNMVQTSFGLAARARACALALAIFGSTFVATMSGLARAQDPATAPAGQATPKAPAQKSATQKQAVAPASGGGDAGLRQRVEQLEEQIVDMQVVIGTLESLAKVPPASPTVAPARAGAPGSGADTARVQSLEAQVQSLTAQMQQMSNDLRAQRGDRRSELPAGTPPVTSAGQPALSGGTVSSFGSTTVTSAPGSTDAIGGLLSGEPAPAKAGEALPDIPGATAPGALGSAAPGPMAALNPSDGADPQQLYSSAYGYLLGQNYGAAQSGFEEFLRKHPRDALAPDALFWLGESHYMQKNFGDAAEAFDLVTSSYGSSTKAPEAQLRRAASLVQLGRKDDACAALRQLNTKYPNARPVLKTKAEAERQRAGCT